MINVLLLDWTKIDNNTATGNNKRILLELENINIFQIYEKNILGKKILKFINYKNNFEKTLLSQTNIREIIDYYNINILIVRPVEQSKKINSLLKQLTYIGKPLIFIYYDNWLNDGIKDRDFYENLIKKSTYVWSISDEMSEYLKSKYNINKIFILQNSIKSNFQNLEKKKNSKILIRYSGSMAKNMNQDTIIYFSKLNLMNCKFEINSKVSWSLRSNISKSFITKNYFGNYQDYLNWIFEADLLLLAYNFDNVSFDYIKYSFANKLPEYLSTGNGIIYLGPQNTSCYNFLKKHKIGFCFDKNDSAIIDFINNYSVEKYKIYNKKNISICEQEFSLDKNKSKLKKVLQECF